MIVTITMLTSRKLVKSIYACTVITARRALSVTQEIAKFNPKVPVTQAHTPPGTWYVDKRIYDLEKSTVFSSNWVAVPGATKLKSPGDYVTGFLADEPYLISVNNQSELKFFYNICRHHGTLLCDQQSGSAEEFVCPYHAWTYSLDGRLTKAKKLRGIEDFSARDYGLKSLSGTKWLQSLFVNMASADCAEFHVRLDPLKSLLAESGCEEGNLTHVETRVYPQKCNWKVVIDNYLDGGYHVPICHKALSSLISQKEYSIEVHDGYSVQTSTGTIDSHSQSRVGDSVIYAHVYPNLFINRYGHWLDMNYVIPTGPETCDVVFDWFYDAEFETQTMEKDKAAVIRDNLRDSERVQDEDTIICTRVQKGMKSRSFTSGRYAPRLEQAMYDFHCKLYCNYMAGLNAK